jgi:hypothetical protein
MKIHDLDKKLLVGIRSPAKPLTDADFKRVRSLTFRKIARFAQSCRRANKLAP